MTQELWLLAATAIFTILHLLPILAARLMTPGAAEWGAGNRQTPFEGKLPPWGDRAIKAHANLLENLPHFAVLVLVAHVSGKANATTLLATQAFLVARVVFLAVYMAGIEKLRTLIFTAGLAAELLIFSQLFG